MNLLTAIEVARILHVSPARVYELARQRMLPALTLGQRQVRFDEATLREWISSGGSAGGAMNITPATAAASQKGD
jgi:excisionase family DNA binding protein